MKTLCALVMSLLLSALVCADDKKKPKPEPTVGELWASAEESETVANLYDQYTDNSIKADKKFKGKKVAVVGIVSSVGKDISGHGTVSLNQGGLENVCVYVDKNRLKEIEDLSKGDYVVMVGTCKGKTLGQVSIEGGRLVNSDADAATLKKKMDDLKATLKK